MSEYMVKLKGIKKVNKKLKKIFRRSLRKIIKQAANEAVKKPGEVSVEIPSWNVMLINEMVKQGAIQNTKADHGDGTYTHTFDIKEEQAEPIQTGE